MRDYAQIGPILIAVLAVLMIYRRMRRSFGRQALRPTRMTVRMVILLALGISLAPLALRSGTFLAMEIAGLAAGLALALWGANRTRYLRRNGQLYYVPHTYTGIAITLLVLGRIMYRIVQIYAATHGTDDAAPSADGFAGPSFVRSPFTVGLFFVLIGYYVCYYSRVLWKSKHLREEDLEIPSAAAASSNAPQDA